MYLVTVAGLGAAVPGPSLFAETIAGSVLKFPVFRCVGVE